MTNRRRYTAFLLLAGLLSLLTPALPAQAEKKETLTVEELVKTQANQLFVTRKFAEALEEFKKLEREYPKDLVIKRYVGACLDHLRRDEEAIEAFKKVLKQNPNDLPSRQFLAKIHLRSGELDRAEEHLTFIVNNDRTLTFAPAARAQLESIKNLKETKEKAREAPGRQLGPDDFLETKAAKAFMNAKYEDALKELEGLQQKYPEDLLIKRYRAMTLDKLGRLDEAVTAFGEALAAVPGNIPLHYFSAQTLVHKNDLEGAKLEFEYVVQNDESRAYQTRAQAELSAVEQLIQRLKAAKPKKWSVNGSGGFDWYSNPSSKSRDKVVRAGPIEESYKFSNSLGGSYELFKRGAFSSKANYSYSHAIYSDSLREISTFSNTWGLNGTYIKPLFGKSLVIQPGSNIVHTAIGQKYYSLAFGESLNLIYSPRDWYRITVNEKWTFTTYDSDGSSPDHTSRDGFGNVAGITNQFYFNKAKNFSATLGFELGNDFTQGANYRKDTYTGRTALHFPLLYKVEGDMSFKFKDSQYPKFHFPATTPGRKDDEYEIKAALSRTFATHWTLNTSYSVTIVNSRDNSYSYTNHIVGCSLSFNY